MRSYGEGRVFLRGRIYHIAYCRNGHEFSESGRTPDEKKARKFLAQRLAQIEKPEFVGPSEKRLILDDPEAEIVADYERHGKRSVATAKYCLKPIKEFFQVRQTDRSHAAKDIGISDRAVKGRDGAGNRQPRGALSAPWI